ncbi:hypothetical protein LNP05_26155 [Klebsiella pneumoniae subsp. pneumoniae]|nr:hypothetical protein [Klebsiella pneumoniae subsp. pneumoniae]
MIEPKSLAPLFSSSRALMLCSLPAFCTGAGAVTVICSEVSSTASPLTAEVSAAMAED